MKMRKITSLTALVSFILLILSSVILYIVPQGRVAYWADWRLWGLTKTQWGDQHIILGVLFLLAISLHIYYNWKPIVSYLKNKARQFRLFTRNFNVALVITAVCVVGAYVEVPPFNWVLDFSESIKESAAQKYGEPPYGHAELSPLKTFASRTGLDLAAAMAQLKKAGVRFNNEKQTLLEIAKLNNMTPKQVHLAMKPEDKPGAVKSLPDSPQGGLGKRALADICREYNLDIVAILKAFADSGISATGNSTIKQIAGQHAIAPVDVYQILKKAAHTDS